MAAFKRLDICFYSLVKAEVSIQLYEIISLERVKTCPNFNALNSGFVKICDVDFSSQHKFWQILKLDRASIPYKNFTVLVAST